MSAQPRTAADPTGSDQVEAVPVQVEAASNVSSSARRSGSATEGFERVDHHVLVVPIGSGGHHVIDFTTHVVEPGQVLHVLPGQVQRWLDERPAGAIVVRVDPDVLPAGLFDPCLAPSVVPLGTGAEIVGAIAHDLLREQRAERPSAPVMITSAVLLMQHVARAVDAATPERSPQLEVLRAFRSEVEASFAATRSVSHYARTIGISQKTLSRATATVVGRSPKEIIDRRVTLEARRLLAHTSEPASTIAATLGFSEPTNFTKYFVRQTGMSPQEFRVGV